jgi:hypothetical protein
VVFLLRSIPQLHTGADVLISVSSGGFGGVEEKKSELIEIAMSKLIFVIPNP